MKSTFKFRRLMVASLTAVACTCSAVWSEEINAMHVAPPLSTPNKKTDIKFFPVAERRDSALVEGTNPPAKLTVTAGLARLLSFRENILSVFFCDGTIIDARALNSRTLAITGKVAGLSRLVVLTSRYSGDVVGKENVCEIAVTQPASAEAEQRADTATRPGETNRGKPINFVSVAQLEQIEQRIPKLKPGMSNTQIFSVLGISNNQLDSIAAAGGIMKFSSYYNYSVYALREGVDLLLVHDYTNKPPTFKRAEIHKKH